MGWITDACRISVVASDMCTSVHVVSSMLKALDFNLNHVGLKASERERVEHRKLGQSTLEVSVLGMGCNNLGHMPDADSSAILHAALDVGVNFFDTAETYAKGASEECLGRVLRHERSRLIFATKFGHPSDSPPGTMRGSRLNMLRSVDGSLRRLGTDYIDIYYLHYPDPQTPMEETLYAFDELIKAGKIRAIGFSNVDATYISQIARCSASHGLQSPAVCQNPFNLLAPEAKYSLLPMLEEFDIGFVPSFPLASGLLTGKYHSATAVHGSLRTRVVPRFAERFLTKNNLEKLKVLERLAREQNLALLDVAFGWLLAYPRVASVIAGATTVDQLRQNAAAANWSMHARKIQKINSALGHYTTIYSACGH